MKWENSSRLCLYLQNQPGTVINPNDVKVITGEGMPQPRSHNRFDKGDLYVEFIVDFPQASQLDDAKREGLRKVLPKPKKIDPYDEHDPLYEPCELKDVDLSQKRSRGDGEPMEAYDEDAPQEGGQHIGCRQG
eukprot:GHVN01020100.1.p2 GENE.GHVN01020100.1~~GHVN01020100.1.p2  ORF type:complete len:133 (-),score=26.03 GHVN01020100.1:3002-3400(-)